MNEQLNEPLIEFRLVKTEEVLSEHDKRLDKIENGQAEFKVQIQNLCKDICGLTAMMKWLVCLLGSSLLGFFIYMVQQMVVK